MTGFEEGGEAMPVQSLFNLIFGHFEPVRQVSF